MNESHTLRLSDRTHAQMEALLKAQHQRNPFPEDLYEHNLESLVECLLMRFLDEQIPSPLEQIDLNTLYFDRKQYLTRLEIISEVVRQLDAISVSSIEVHQMIRLITKEQVLRQITVQGAIREYEQAIARHPNYRPVPTWPAEWEARKEGWELISPAVEAAETPSETMAEEEIVCDGELLKMLLAIGGA